MKHPRDSYAFLTMCKQGDVGVRAEGTGLRFSLYFGPGLPAIEEQADQLKKQIDRMLATARRHLNGGADPS